MAILGSVLVGNESTDDEQWARRSTLTYNVWASQGADANYVRENCGFAKFSPHPYDSGQFVLSRRAADQGYTVYKDSNNNPTDSNLFEVTIEYGPFDPYTMTSTGNPSDIKLLATWVNQRFPDIADVGIVGTNADGSPKYAPILNSAGDPYDPGITRDRISGVFKVVENRTQGSYNPASLGATNMYINSDVWNGFPKHTIRWAIPELPDQPFSMFLGLNYYRLEHVFEYNALTWDANPYDMGYRCLDKDGNAVRILDYRGERLDKPAFLDGQGNQLPSDGSMQPVSQTYQIYNEISFASTFGPKFQALFP